MAIKEVDFSRFYDFVNKSFWNFIKDISRIRISYGGAGSGKSFSAFQEMIYKVVTEPGHNYLVCRKVGTSNRISTFPLAQQIITEFGLWPIFKMNKSDMSLTCTLNGNMIIFKGLDDIEKIKSITFPKGILTDILIEEASEISQKDFDQLNVRLRGRLRGPAKKIKFQITLLLNPISDQHWIKREFIDIKSYQRKYNVKILKTTFKHNRFIDADYRQVLESYKEIDYEFYRVYCLGEWGTYGNLIFKNWTALKCPYQESDFDAIYNGMDFGFEHPAVIVKIGFKDGAMYTYNELCCEKKTNMEFIQLNEEFDILHKGERATADSAEPARIKEWIQHGYGVIGAVKGKDSVSRGIDYLKTQRWFIDPTKCPRTLQEAQVYHRKTDKNGEVNKNEDPVDIFDDALKSHFYGLEQLSRMKGNPSVLSGTKTDQKKALIDQKKEERKKMREVFKTQRRKVRETKKQLTIQEELIKKSKLL